MMKICLLDLLRSLTMRLITKTKKISPITMMMIGATRMAVRGCLRNKWSNWRKVLFQFG